MSKETETTTVVTSKEVKTDSPKTGDQNTLQQARQIASAQPNHFATQSTSTPVVVEAETVIVNTQPEPQPKSEEPPFSGAEGTVPVVYVVGNRTLSADGVEVKKK